ncbi:malonyl-CoA decarboxylase domain-containing protein, partial [Roseomonas rosulenta]|uniref:malonyl-CoA decarboxylase domain-containing protein n=1 Tax=Roseomonas rosulenta TaxID=2748667 RepID=UPI0018DFD0D2
PPASPASEGAADDAVAALQRLIARRGWLRDEAAAKVLEPLLTRLCARYLAKEDAAGRPGRARDPVAHFHLSNGARIERLNWRADTSDNGMRQAFGLMVNYLYDPDRIEENHEGYVGEGRRAVSAALKRFAKG